MEYYAIYIVFSIILEKKNEWYYLKNLLRFYINIQAKRMILQNIIKAYEIKYNSIIETQGPSIGSYPLCSYRRLPFKSCIDWQWLTSIGIGTRRWACPIIHVDYR